MISAVKKVSESSRERGIVLDIKCRGGGKMITEYLGYEEAENV